MFASGEKGDIDLVNRPFRRVCGVREHKKFGKDEGHNKREQIKRMKAKNEKISLASRPFFTGGNYWLHL